MDIMSDDRFGKTPLLSIQNVDLLTKSRHQRAGSSSPVFPLLKVPALLIRTSARPKCAAMFSYMVFTSFSELMSVLWIRIVVVVDIPLIFSAVALSVDRLRPTRTIPTAPAVAHATAQS